MNNINYLVYLSIQSNNNIYTWSFIIEDKNKKVLYRQNSGGRTTTWYIIKDILEFLDKNLQHNSKIGIMTNSEDLFKIVLRNSSRGKMINQFISFVPVDHNNHLYYSAVNSATAMFKNLE